MDHWQFRTDPETEPIMPENLLRHELIYKPLMK